MTDDDRREWATQLAIGRLEGRVGAVETQVSTLGNRTDRQLNAVASKMGDIETRMGTLESVLVDLKATLKTSWHSVVIVTACGAALVSMIGTIWNTFHHG